MKKVLYFAALLFCAGMTSCEKEEIGGTATENMAGQWVVQIDAIDDSGNPIEQGEDYFGLGNTIMLTYNTSGNSATEMWIDDMGEYDLATQYGNPAYPNYSLKTKVAINQDALTFSSSNAANESGAFSVSIDGKILKGAGRQNNGSPADSIVFFVTYTNDPWYPDDGYTKYKVSGIRYSGLVENER